MKMENNISNETLENLAKTHIRNMKSKRRWKIFVRSLVILLAAGLIISNLFSSSKQNFDHIGLIKVDGIIAADSQTNAQRINKSLDSAYSNKSIKAVIIEINSPGGSPVQSEEIFSHMQFLQKKHPKIPIYAVCTDVCASGGYYIAAGAKEIYANKMSITGSIGVTGSNFGFTQLMDKLGIERRTYMSGKNKNFLDPFSPQNSEQVKSYQKILNQSHQIFINAVLESRGDRLEDQLKDIAFSGAPFSGIEAKKIGLTDGFASIEKLKREKLNNLKVVDYTEPLNFFTTLSQKLGNSIYYKALSENGFNFKY